MSVVRGLTSALAQKGVECEIVSAMGKRVGIGETPVEGVRQHRFKTQLPAHIWAGYSGGLAQFVNERAAEFDLIHIHEIWNYPCYVAFQAARRCGVPYIVSPHGELDEWRMRHKGFKKGIYMRLIQRRILNSAAAVHALTKADAECIRQQGRLKAVFIAPNGVDIERSDYSPAPDREGFLSKYPQLRGKRVALFLGRLHAMKGLDVLTHAFVRIADKFDDAMLLIAGPDDDGAGNKIAATLDAAGLQHRAVFTGMLTGRDKAAAFACSDLFVLSSHSEGFSISVLEAMRSGLPVVVSEQCHFPEVAEYGAGFAVELSAEAVGDAMAALLWDDDRRRRMGQNGRAMVRERYTWAAIAESMAGFYKMAGG